MQMAVMKAVCYSQQWIKKFDMIAKQNSNEFGAKASLGTQSEVRNYDCRILVIQLGQDDPNQFNPFINAVFASQKLKMCIDCLVMDLTNQQMTEPESAPLTYDISANQQIKFNT